MSTTSKLRAQLEAKLDRQKKAVEETQAQIKELETLTQKR